MERGYHGGNCCGIQHVYSFGSFNITNQRDLAIRINQCKSDRKTIPLIEVALTQAQCENGWEGYLVNEVGFRKVATWLNPNSGRVVSLFILTQEFLNEKAEAAAAELMLARQAEEAAAEAAKAAEKAEIEAAKAANVIPVVAKLVTRRKRLASALPTAAARPLLRKRKKAVE